MPLYLELGFSILSIILSIIGIALGGKALYNIKISNKNVQNTIISGIDADGIVKIINSLSQSDFVKIQGEISKKFEKIDQELSARPRVFVGKDVPDEAKCGDIWFQEVDDEKK